MRYSIKINLIHSLKRYKDFFMLIRFAYIDVLKALAIIAVVLYHTGLMPYGYLGVDVFFVIAGFFTTRSLYRIILIADRPTIRGGYFTFEISRIVRLLPPLLIAGTVCMFLGFMTMLPDDYENLSQSVIATNFFGNNILGAITTGNYWDVVNDYKPLMHTWYVGVLMQFYIVYPFLFYSARLDKRNPRGTFITILATLAVISLLLYFATTNTSQRFYFLPSRFFEFAVGGIAAIFYKPLEDKPFGKGFVYVCYILLLVLMFVHVDVIPTNIRLVVVVVLSCVLLCSQDVLENKVTGNVIISKIGSASYSIFIWHQVLLAFYRYTTTSKFSIGSYSVLLVATLLLSWFSYIIVEQGVVKALNTKRGKLTVYSIVAIIFFALNVFAGIVYLRAGVVRDVPELYIRKSDVHRGIHAEYVDRGYKFDKDFSTTDKNHWYVIGNSFGRDFVNVILESSVAEHIEISYSTEEQFQSKSERFANADRVFLSTHGLTEDLVSRIEIMCLANGLNRDQLTIVGEKNFGESNGQIYSNRNQPNYFDQYIDVEDVERYITRNQKFAKLYGPRFLDLMALVTNKENKVRVFSPDCHFMSADCRHLSKGGAKYFADTIEWNRFLK